MPASGWKLGLPAAIVCSVGAWLTAGLLQADAPPQKRKIPSTSLPAIDLGLWSGPMSPPRTTRVRPGDDQRPYVAGRVLVKFRDGTSANARAAALSAAQARGSSAMDWADFDIVSLDPTADPEAVARALSQRPDVLYAQADYIAHPTFTPNDPLFAQQWNLAAQALDMPRAWDINNGASASIIVAVLDTGLAYNNEIVTFQTRGVLADNRVYPSLGQIDVPFAAAPDLGAGRVVSPRDFIWNDNDPLDFDGHGTHVTGTIGQATNNGVGVAGMAFNVRIMPLKVIATDWDFAFGNNNFGSAATVAAGIRYAVDNGARVLNLSLGFDGATSLPAVEEAVQYAVSRGAFVSIAAGNNFEEGNPVEALAEIANRVDGAVSVAAVGRTLQRAYYSSRRTSVEISAPGGDLRADPSGGITQQTYDFGFSVPDPFSAPVSQYRAPRFDVFRFVPFQGTSMAAPHVAGLAAMLMQQGIDNPRAIEVAMKRFATDRGTPGRDDDFGIGLINPRATLRGLGLSR